MAQYRPPVMGQSNYSGANDLFKRAQDLMNLGIQQAGNTATGLGQAANVANLAALQQIAQQAKTSQEFNSPDMQTAMQNQIAQAGKWIDPTAVNKLMDTRPAELDARNLAQAQTQQAQNVLQDDQTLAQVNALRMAGKGKEADALLASSPLKTAAGVSGAYGFGQGMTKDALSNIATQLGIDTSKFNLSTAQGRAGLENALLAAQVQGANLQNTHRGLALQDAFNNMNPSGFAGFDDEGNEVFSPAPGNVAAGSGKRTQAYEQARTPVANQDGSMRIGQVTVPKGAHPATAYVIGQESLGKLNVGSSKVGARGVAQVMPDSARDPGYGVKPLANNSPQEAVRFASDYLTALTKKYNGDTAKALAAYNWGPGSVDNAVKKHGNNWLANAPKETRDYVNEIGSRMGSGRIQQAAQPQRASGGGIAAQAIQQPVTGGFGIGGGISAGLTNQQGSPDARRYEKDKPMRRSDWYASLGLTPAQLSRMSPAEQQIAKGYVDELEVFSNEQSLKRFAGLAGSGEKLTGDMDVWVDKKLSNAGQKKLAADDRWLTTKVASAIWSPYDTFTGKTASGNFNRESTKVNAVADMARTLMKSNDPNAIKQQLQTALGDSKEAKQLANLDTSGIPPSFWESVANNYMSTVDNHLLAGSSRSDYQKYAAQLFVKTLNSVKKDNLQKYTAEHEKKTAQLQRKLQEDLSKNRSKAMAWPG